MKHLLQSSCGIILLGCLTSSASAGTVAFNTYYEGNTDWTTHADSAVYQQAMDGLLDQFADGLRGVNPGTTNIDIFFTDDETSAFASASSNGIYRVGSGNTLHYATNAWKQLVEGAADPNGATAVDPSDSNRFINTAITVDWNFNKSTPDSNVGLARHELLHGFGMSSLLNRDTEVPLLDIVTKIATRNGVGNEVEFASVSDLQIVGFDRAAYLTQGATGYEIADYSLNPDWEVGVSSGIAFHGIADDGSDMFLDMALAGAGGDNARVDFSHTTANYANVHPTWHTVEEVDRAFLRGLGYTIVPEPSSMTLFSLGSLGLILRRRK